MLGEVFLQAPYCRCAFAWSQPCFRIQSTEQSKGVRSALIQAERTKAFDKFDCSKWLVYGVSADNQLVII
jgi:hypothetical protein